MIVRHTETRSYQEPSVRFYRTIALAFLCVAVVLIGVVMFITSKKATITIVAKEDSSTVTMSVPVGVNVTNGVTGTVATSTFFWKEKYYPTGFKTSESVAIGEVIIYNKTNQAQTLVKTTRLLTPTNILFRLSDRVTIPANGQITASVYADVAGQTSEIGPSQFIIPGLPVDKQKFVYAESKGNMVGGVRKVGILTDADILAAKKDFAGKVEEKFPVTPVGNMAVAITVLDQVAEADRKAGEEVDGFFVSGTSTILIVNYDATTLKLMVEKEMAGKTESGAEKILAVSGEPRVTVVKGDTANNTAELSVRQEASATIDPDADELNPKVFLGKTKEEIERYVMGLSHVTATEVKFSPSWMRKAPTVPDRIKVIVKNVK